jgi:hypothetical protein
VFGLGCIPILGIPALEGRLLPTKPLTLSSVLNHPGGSGLTDIPDVLVWLVAAPLFAWSFIRQFAVIQRMFAKLQRNKVTGRSMADYNANFVTRANEQYGSLIPTLFALTFALLWLIGYTAMRLWPVAPFSLLKGAQIIAVLMQSLGIFAGATYFFRYQTTFRLLRTLLDKRRVQPRLMENQKLGGFWPIVTFAEQTFVGFATIGFIVMSQSDISVPLLHQGSLTPGDQLWTLAIALADIVILLILLYLPLGLIFSRLRFAKYRLLRRIGVARSGRVWRDYRRNNINDMLPLLASMEDARQIIESLPGSLFSKHSARRESFLLLAAAIATQLAPS